MLADTMTSFEKSELVRQILLQGTGALVVLMIAYRLCFGSKSKE